MPFACTLDNTSRDKIVILGFGNSVACMIKFQGQFSLVLNLLVFCDVVFATAPIVNVAYAHKTFNNR